VALVPRQWENIQCFIALAELPLLPLHAQSTTLDVAAAAVVISAGLCVAVLETASQFGGPGAAAVSKTSITLAELLLLPLKAPLDFAAAAAAAVLGDCAPAGHCVAVLCLRLMRI
jgi:hypothetical protein